MGPCPSDCPAHSVCDQQLARSPHWARALQVAAYAFKHKASGANSNRGVALTCSKSTESPEQEFRSTWQLRGGSVSSVWTTSALPVAADRGAADRGAVETEAPIHQQVVRMRSSWNVTKSKLGTALFHCPTSDQVTLNNVKPHIYQRISIGSYYFCHLKKCLPVLNLGT